MSRLSLSLIAILLCTLTQWTAQAGNITYTYDTGRGEATAFGTNKKENYDVAIWLEGNELAGAKITKIRIPFRSTENLSNLKVWLSTELIMEKVEGKNSKEIRPDICTQNVDMATWNDGFIDVALDQAYTLTDKGIYVGYSFNVDALTDKTSRPVLTTSEKADNGLYIHSSRTYLNFYNKSVNGSSAMQVIVEDAKDDASSLLINDTDIHFAINQSPTLEFTLINKGSNGISSIDYEITVADKAPISRHLDISNEKFPAIYDYNKTISINIDPISEKGQYPLSIKITKVNDKNNSALYDNIATATLYAYTVLPKHRAVFEEYTGMWCGYCPRGYVALQMLNELFPDDFIAIAYHNKDIISVTNNNYPSAVSGFPNAWIDRVNNCDPFYGDTPGQFGAKNVWENRCKFIAPALIDVQATFDSETNRVDAKADIEFVKSFDEATFEIEYIMVGDSLHGTDYNWVQHSYFQNQEGWEDYPYMQPFIDDENVKGLYYNDTFLASSRLNDANTTLPASIEDGSKHSGEYTFNLSEIRNTSGNPIAFDPTNLRVIALLVNKTTGEVLNANKIDVTQSSSIKDINIQNTNKCTEEYYDLFGRKVADPQQGLFIKRNTDGTFVKIIL